MIREASKKDQNQKQWICWSSSRHWSSSPPPPEVRLTSRLVLAEWLWAMYSAQTDVMTVSARAPDPPALDIPACNADPVKYSTRTCATNACADWRVLTRANLIRVIRRCSAPEEDDQKMNWMIGKNNGNGLNITELPITIRCKIECTRNNPSLSRFDDVLSPRVPALVRPIGYFRNTHFVDLYVPRYFSKILFFIWSVWSSKSSSSSRLDLALQKGLALHSTQQKGLAFHLTHKTSF